MIPIPNWMSLFVGPAIRLTQTQKRSHSYDMVQFNSIETPFDETLLVGGMRETIPLSLLLLSHRDNLLRSENRTSRIYHSEQNEKVSCLCYNFNGIILKSLIIS